MVTRENICGQKSTGQKKNQALSTGGSITEVRLKNDWRKQIGRQEWFLSYYVKF